MAVGRHLFPGTAVDNGDVRTQAPGGAGHVHGHVAAADDRQFLAHRIGFAQGLPAEKIHSLDHAFRIFPGDVHLAAHMTAYPQEDRFVALLLQVIQREIPPHGGVGLQFDTQAQDIIDLLIQDIFREAIIRDTHPQHAAGLGQGFEDRGPVAPQGQVIGAGHTGRAAAHDGHFLAPRLSLEQGNIFDVDGIGRIAFQAADGHRLVHILAAAFVFTGMGADPAQDAGQRQPVHDQFQGFRRLAGLDQLDIALDLNFRRAGDGAGGPVQLLDGKGGRNGLGIETINGLAFVQPHVEFVGDPHRADLGAVAAAGAFGGVDVAGLLLHGYREVPRFAGNGLHFGQGVDLDVQVPAAFHQLGGNDAHGAVIGGEGLVQLGHDAADGRLLFHQMYVKTRVSQVQGRLHPGDPGADYHYLDLLDLLLWLP